MDFQRLLDREGRVDGRTSSIFRRNQTTSIALFSITYVAVEAG